MSTPQASSGTAPTKPYIGGQALLEGVMMRSPQSFAMVVRRRDGSLEMRERPMSDERTGVRAFPLIRGMVMLVESLKLGGEALRFASGIYEEDFDEAEAEEAKKAGKEAGSKLSQTISALSLPIIQMVTRADEDVDAETAQQAEPQATPAPAAKQAANTAEEETVDPKVRAMQIFSFVIAIGLFVALPQAGANLVSRLFGLNTDIRSVSFQAITGGLKLLIVISYMALIRRLPEVYRIFQYHGAEHKCISTYEAQEPLVVEHAKAKTTLHPRCGTTFLVMVAVVSVLVFSAIGPLLPNIGAGNAVVQNLVFFAMKLPFLPVIAGITYELQRFSARYCTTGPLRVLLWPGFLVQKITTIEPDNAQLEVALASLRVTLEREEKTAELGDNARQARFPSFQEFIQHTGLVEMIPIDKLEAIARRYREVEALLCSPEALSDVKRARKLHEERAHAEPLMEAFAEYKQVQGDLADHSEALSDPELKELAEAEIPELETRQKELERKLAVLLLPRDPRDGKNVILEVRGGEGGEEAALFAADIFRMFVRFAERKRWKVELMSQSESSTGGFKEVIALVKGADVFSHLRFEGGVHRVQRVPKTETQGRIHTSTASVAIMPEADDLDIHIDPQDLEINIAASGGPGGQGVNTTNSAVQIQHKPSGIIVKCQDERSQHKNKAKAMKVLKSRLYAIEVEKQQAALDEERRSMVGTAERSSKVRTYNYPQNRVTDHRIGLTLHKLEKIVAGELDELVEALRTHHQAELLEREGLSDSMA